MTPLDAIRAAARESREREERVIPGPWERESAGRDDSSHQTIVATDPRTGEDLILCDSLNSDTVCLAYDSEDGYTSDEGSIDNFDFIASARTELGQWREVAEKACAALDRIRQGDPYVQGLRPELYGHAMKLADDVLVELAAVAEKLRRGRG